MVVRLSSVCRIAASKSLRSPIRIFAEPRMDHRGSIVVAVKVYDALSSVLLYVYMVYPYNQAAHRMTETEG